MSPILRERAAVFFIAICASLYAGQAMALDWRGRTAPQLAVGIKHDLIKGIIGTFREADTENFSARLSAAGYPSKTHPAHAAYLFLIQIHPGFRYPDPMSARDAITNLSHLADLNPTVGTEASVTAIGKRFEVLPFEFQDVECFALASSWGAENLEQAGSVTGALQGYFCHDRKVPMKPVDIQSLLSAIRVSD